MTIEIKTASVTPIRTGYSHLLKRFGDKPATRYQEATYDVQAVTNFHYKPLWQPEYELNDASRTALHMNDWYDFKDPRQYFYGAYVMQRSKMQDRAENNYEFFEKRRLADALAEPALRSIIQFLLPLRHYEQTANLNNMFGTAYGYGTAITQPLLYHAMDRLANAQSLSRIGLLLDDNSGDALGASKKHWMEAECWQGVRALCEETLVTQDWFELFIAQDVVMDHLVFDLFYQQFDQRLVAEGAADIAMLTDFMRDWRKDSIRWVDAVVKIAIKESPQNQELVSGWVARWRTKAQAALQPIAAEMLTPAALDRALQDFDQKMQKLGV